MRLIEDEGKIALYQDGNWVYADYQGKRIKLNLPWDFNSNGDDHGWKAISADFLPNPSPIAADYPYEDILLLWENGQDRWQALTFSTTSGDLTGLVSVVGEFYSNQELIDLHNSSSAAWYGPVADQTYFSTTGFYSNDPLYMTQSEVHSRLGLMIGEIYTGIARESSRTYEQNQTYELGGIKDFDGTPHANPEPISDLAKQSYKYQGMVDVNKNGESEAIFTNKITGRWATASISSSGEIDYTDYGKDGTTRIVGIYIDPLVTSGDVVQFSDHDSQYRFQNDLKIDNLLVKTSGDFDSDGVQEVYWKTADGSAYLRSLMHSDGNIRYANYQSEEQMSNYLTANGYESIISDIT